MDSQAEYASLSGDAAATISHSGSLTIFVVDDDTSVCRSLARLFRSAGFDVATFHSAHDFLERSAFAEPGCLVLDLRMPGMTGLELYDWMTKHELTMPVVFLTGHGDVRTCADAMKKGAVDFLQKPVEDITLLKSVREAIERHRDRRIKEQEQRSIEARLSRLSPRESEVSQLVIGGHLNKQIADRMGISIKTVKAHRARVMEKMEVHSVAALVHLYETVGISAWAIRR